MVIANKSRKRVTISSVAAKLDLSPGTVSFVLSGQAKRRGIAEKTAALVRKTADEMGYVPNHWAKSLQSKRTGIIKILFSDLQMGLAGSIMDGILDVLGPRESTPVMVLHDRLPLLKEPVGGIRRREILSILQCSDDGVICQPKPQAREDYAALLRQAVPLVFVGNDLENSEDLDSVSSVTWDCFPAAKTAVQYLIETGHKRIAFVGSRHGLKSDVQRFDAYMETLREANIATNENWIFWSPPDTGVSQQFMEKMFNGSSEVPDAIFAVNDAVAIWLLQVLADMGLKVPEDVAVMGMGDLPVGRHSLIGLTTMREPLAEMGREAANVVLELSENPGHGPIHRNISCNELKVRRTA